MFTFFGEKRADLASLLYIMFIRRRQSSGFYRRLLRPVVSDYVLIIRASKEQALYQAIKYRTPSWHKNHKNLFFLGGGGGGGVKSIKTA